LELVPLARADDDDLKTRPPVDPKAKPPEEEWELVSAKIAEDGLTEQRVYRRPA
jgi:hypothetical protein